MDGKKHGEGSISYGTQEEVEEQEKVKEKSTYSELKNARL